jgi:hypothetical protein
MHNFSFVIIFYKTITLSQKKLTIKHIKPNPYDKTIIINN